jgi:hypothetical protein
MSISYPLSPPSSYPAPVRSVRITANNIAGASVSPFTLQTQTYEWPGEGFELSVSLAPMKTDDAEVWVAWLTSLRGIIGTFYFGDPFRTTPRGVATGTPVVNGNQSAGSKTLAVKGWSHSITGILKAGDYIQVGTTPKRLYKVLVDANSDSSGHCTLDIFPRLREAVSDAQSVVTSDCLGLFRLADNRREWDINLASIYGISFKAVEAL